MNLLNVHRQQAHRAIFSTSGIFPVVTAVPTEGPDTLLLTDDTKQYRVVTSSVVPWEVLAGHLDDVLYVVGRAPDGSAATLERFERNETPQRVVLGPTPTSAADLLLGAPEHPWA